MSSKYGILIMSSSLVLAFYRLSCTEERIIVRLVLKAKNKLEFIVEFERKTCFHLLAGWYTCRLGCRHGNRATCRWLCPLLCLLFGKTKCTPVSTCEG